MNPAQARDYSHKYFSRKLYEPAKQKKPSNLEATFSSCAGNFGASFLNLSDEAWSKNILEGFSFHGIYGLSFARICREHNKYHGAHTYVRGTPVLGQLIPVNNEASPGNRKHHRKISRSSDPGGDHSRRGRAPRPAALDDAVASDPLSRWKRSRERQPGEGGVGPGGLYLLSWGFIPIPPI